VLDRELDQLAPSPSSSSSSSSSRGRGRGGITTPSRGGRGGRGGSSGTTGGGRGSFTMDNRTTIVRVARPPADFNEELIKNHFASYGDIASVATTPAGVDVKFANRRTAETVHNFDMIGK
jgi:hypothetical protein